MDALSYRCEFFSALNASMDVTPITENTTESARRELDALLLPHVCTTNAKALAYCWRQTRPTVDPPVVFVLNKAFERLQSKLQTVADNLQRVALLISPSPEVDWWGHTFRPRAGSSELGTVGRPAAGGSGSDATRPITIRTAFFPYAAPLAMGRHAFGANMSSLLRGERRALIDADGYKHDFGFSGGW